jgi:uncharacterized protein involved in exopolysaccharide biosynthesis
VSADVAQPVLRPVEEEWVRPPLYRWGIVAPLCIAIVLLSVASAVFVGTRPATRYGARADLLYDAPASVPLDVRQRGVATQRGLILSRAVLEPVARGTGLPLTDLERSVSVALDTQDDLMHITVGASTRDRAVTLTRLVAASYLRTAREFDPARSADRGEPTPRLLAGAYPLPGRLSPQPLRAAAAGLLVGLALATGTAVLLVRRRRSRSW